MSLLNNGFKITFEADELVVPMSQSAATGMTMQRNIRFYSDHAPTDEVLSLSSMAAQIAFASAVIKAVAELEWTLSREHRKEDH